MCAQTGHYQISIISTCMKNKSRLRVLVWLLNYQNCIVITNTGVFSVSIVDVHASNPMAHELAYGIVIIVGWIPESFLHDRSASS